MTSRSRNKRASMYALPELTIVLAAFVGALLAGCQRGSAQVFDDPTAAAEKGLQSLKNLVDGENYHELGFDAPGEVANATVGNRLPIFLVRLDQLKVYQTGVDPVTLLVDAGQSFYPVMVGGQTRCSIIVERVDGKWRTASLGNSELAKLVAQAPGASVVQVPALGVYFTANTRSDGTLELTSLGTSENYKLKAGDKRSADEVFTALALYAQTHNNLPM